MRGMKREEVTQARGGRCGSKKGRGGRGDSAPELAEGRGTAGASRPNAACKSHSSAHQLGGLK